MVTPVGVLPKSGNPWDIWMRSPWTRTSFFSILLHFWDNLIQAKQNSSALERDLRIQWYKYISVNFRNAKQSIHHHACLFDASNISEIRRSHFEDFVCCGDPTCCVLLRLSLSFPKDRVHTKREIEYRGHPGGITVKFIDWKICERKWWLPRNSLTTNGELLLLAWLRRWFAIHRIFECFGVFFEKIESPNIKKYFIDYVHVILE
jgi:hypothetical protein